jgi:hypothetical protein
MDVVAAAPPPPPPPLSAERVLLRVLPLPLAFCSAYERNGA